MQATSPARLHIESARQLQSPGGQQPGQVPDGEGHSSASGCLDQGGRVERSRGGRELKFSKDPSKEEKQFQAVPEEGRKRNFKSWSQLEALIPFMLA